MIVRASLGGAAWPRLLFLSVLMSCAAAGAGGSELPPRDWAGQIVGQAWVYLRGDGGCHRRTLIEITDDHYLYEVREGADGSGPLKSRDWFDHEGRQTRWFNGRTEWRYSPFFCQRVVGKCSHEGRRADGEVSFRQDRVAQYDGRRLTWRLYGGGEPVANGWDVLDQETGWVAESSVSMSNGATRTRRLLRIETPSIEGGPVNVRRISEGVCPVGFTS